MSGEPAPWPAHARGLLRGSRSRSYGSLVRSPVSPVSPGRQRRVEHDLQPGETLQGLALKYGVSMEQIKRANRLYTNDSIFLKRTLSIPVPSEPGDCGLSAGLADGDGVGGSAHAGQTGSSSESRRLEGDQRPSDLTPVDFLKRLDKLINQSKQAAVRGCEGAEGRVAALEAACSGRTSDLRPLTRSQSVTSAPAAHRAPPLTITKLTKKLRDREDEIFEL